MISFLKNIIFTMYHSFIVTFLFLGLRLLLFGHNKITQGCCLVSGRHLKSPTVSFFCSVVNKLARVIYVLPSTLVVFLSIKTNKPRKGYRVQDVTNGCYKFVFLPTTLHVLKALRWSTLTLVNVSFTHTLLDSQSK